MMITFIVYNKNNEQIGIGYAISYDDTWGIPTLIAESGEELPPDMYHLFPVNQQLVVLTDIVQ